MSATKTHTSFIKECVEDYGNKYDYSLVEYINAHTKIKIKCGIHGEFSMKPNNHLNGQGCPKCGKLNITSNTKKFIIDSNVIHNNKYDYSKVNYVNSKLKVKILCKEHGMFLQQPNGHLSGQGCPKCSHNYKVSEKEFVDRSNQIHNNFYTYENCGYKNVTTKVRINCPIHGDFRQKPSNHLQGQRCYKCGTKNSLEFFIKRGDEIHNHKYDYSKVEYKSMKDKVDIICLEHGIFNQKAGNHINSGHGCPKCGNISKGEEKINFILKLLKLKFKEQHTFKNCRNKKPLHFDFFIPKYNTLIEYDGVQHFGPVDFFGGTESFKKLSMNDNIKNDFCKRQNIKLIRISYNEYENIENILKNELLLNG